jgi:hypothetical protein
MVRAAISPVSIDLQTQKNFTALAEAINGRLDMNNLNMQVLHGTTAETSDTEKQFTHSMSPQPHTWLPLVGDVYIQSISDATIDVRSTKKNVAFKILCISGGRITEETVTNPSTYVDTLGIIDERISGLGSTDLGLLSTLTQGGGFAGSNITQAIAIGNYIYCTLNGSANYNTTVKRINRSSGVVDTVSPGGTQLAAMYYDQTSLWVCEKNSNTTTLHIYEINLSTFTVASTITGTITSVGGSYIQDIASLYLTSTHVYVGGQNTLGTLYSRIDKIVRSSGANAGIINSSAGTAAGQGGFKSIIYTDTFAYGFNTDNISTATIKMAKIDMSTFTLSSTVTITGTTGMSWQAGVRVGNYIYGIAEAVSATPSASPNTYYTAIIKYSTADDSFTIIPVNYPETHTYGATGSSAFTTKSMYTDGTSIYWATFFNDNATARLFIYNTADSTISSGKVPCGINLTTINAALNCFLIADTDNSPLFLKSGSTAGSTPFNFTWTQVLL